MSTVMRIHPIICREDLNSVMILKEHFRQYFDPTDLELAVSNLRNHMRHDTLRAITNI